MQITFELFNVKLGLYEKEITDYNYCYSLESAEETLQDNPGIFVENGGNWVFTQANFYIQPY